MTKVDILIAAIKKQHAYGFKPIDGEAPLWDDDDIIVADRGDYTEICWEGGPYQWTYSFPGGGIDEEFGGTIPAVSTGRLIAGEHFDAQTSYSISLG